MQGNIGILVATHLRQQVRHQLIQLVTAARPDGAFIHVTAEFGDLPQQLPLSFRRELRHQMSDIVVLKRINPQAAELGVLRIFADVRRVITNQIIKHGAHRQHMGIQGVEQRWPVREVHPPCQTRLIEVVGWQGLSLFISNRLQQVFEATQKQIAFTQLRHLHGGQQLQLLHRLQGRQ